MAAVSDLKILLLILRGITLLYLKIFSLSLVVKSPSGPINIHKVSLLLRFIFFFLHLNHQK